MNPDEIIELLDALVVLPRRDTLNVILKAKVPQTAAEIAHYLNISINEVLDHLHVLERVGIISSRKELANGNGTRVWYFVRPLRLVISISEEGVNFAESKLGFWGRLRGFFKV